MTNLSKELTCPRTVEGAYQPIIMSVPPIHWEMSKSTFLGNVVSNFRKIYIKRLNTFGELSANPLDYCRDIRSTWISFVFEANIVIENSVKYYDRTRKSQARTIEISYIARAIS